MKMNLPPTANGTQRCVSAGASKPLRLARLVMTARQVLRGDRCFLRAFRAAEMDAWVAGRPFVEGNFKV